MDTLMVNDKEYEVIKLLGKGKGGYSYLVQNDNKEQFVLKKIHHEPCSYYQFGNKIESEKNDYNKLSEIGITLPKLYEIDEQREHILKEYIDGDTVYQMIANGMDVSECLRQVKIMCEKLYAANTNIDYFPTNFVMQNNILYYIDYECNSYMEEWNLENWGIKYWSKTAEFIQYEKEHK